MTRRVKQRGSGSKGKEKVIVWPAHPENLEQQEIPPPDDAAGGGDGGGGREVVQAVANVDWTSLTDDAAIQVLSCLNYRDRASLASTCRSWRSLASAPCLWTSLDLRAHACGNDKAAALAGRCANLRDLRFRGSDTAAAVMFLQALGLREIVGDQCQDVSDTTLAVIAARHEALESLQIGESLERITSDGIRHVAMCCTRLRRLRLMGVREVGGDAINALAKHCPVLEEIAFIDCGIVDEGAIGNVSTLKFLSVAGSKKMRWGIASFSWSNLQNLLGVDISRTDATPSFVSRLLAQTKSLKIISALNCPALEEEISHNPLAFTSTRGKLLMTLFNDLCTGICSLFAVPVEKEREIFDEGENWSNKDIIQTLRWLEWILSHALLRIAETVPHGMNEFWLKKGAALLLGLIKSSQEDVQERAATGLATFVVVDDENATVDPLMAETVMRLGGIPLLLELARSPQEGIQSEAAKAIANLSVNSRVAKAVADEGGINILAGLARSMNRHVAEEAAGGLWNLSVGEEHKAAIAKSGAVKALVDLVFRWPSGTDGVLERAAGALANLAADDNCSMEIAKAGGVHALVMLAKSCRVEGVQEQAARALANLAAHGDSNSNNAAVGKEEGALEALVQLISSQNEGVRQEAAGALWNLSFDDRNREAIAAAGGVEALVALADSCMMSASRGLQERAAGALWGLSVSEANSIAIGREGGVAPLIALAKSDAQDVHETAAGALWNLAFNPDNAIIIVRKGGVPALIILCSNSFSKMARFMAALALTYIFDGRMEEVALVREPTAEFILGGFNVEGIRRVALKTIQEFFLSFSDPQVFSTAAASSTPAALVQLAEALRIQEAGHLRCSMSEIGRFVSMLRNPLSILRACAAFALLQFTLPGGGHALHHAGLLQKAGAARVLRAAAAAANATIEAKIFARIVLRNLEHHHQETLL